MAAISNAAVAVTGTSPSDILRSSTSGVRGVPLKSLVRTHSAAGRRDFTVSAKAKKGKKHDYPWPDDADPNVKGGVLYHLSHFKPLKEKPKPVTLEFEKPLMALEKKITDVRKMANETGLDFSNQIQSLENKYQQALKDLYTHLTPIQRVNIARHPNRPTFLDHVFNITEKFVELHGDRGGYDDPAIVTGIGTIDGKRYMFMGHQKGRNTKENIQRNFGMPTPHGYRKALRMMYYADHHGFPIVTFIDTPGAFADLKSEELGQGEAIAHNLRTMFGLKVPIISIVIGEGGSGGALAIGCANKLLMLENAVFYVASEFMVPLEGAIGCFNVFLGYIFITFTKKSPEACAAILWKTAKASPKAAEKLKITAGELCKLQIADGVIPEPLGGAHADSAWTSQQIKKAINETMDELMKMNTEELLKHRMLKFRKIGGFQEGIPIDPKRKVNMKMKEKPITGKSSEQELEGEVEKLKQQILKAGESSSKPPMLSMNEMIEKLKREVNLEYADAVEAIGLKDKLVMLRDEYTKAKNSQNQAALSSLKDKFQKLSAELDKGLPGAPNYSSLMYKLDMLKEISKAKRLAERNEKAVTLKQEVNKKFKYVLDRSDFQQKIESLKEDFENSAGSDDGLKEKIVKVKNELQLELADTLKSLNLDVMLKKPKIKDLDESALANMKVKVEDFNAEIKDEINNVVKSTELQKKIDLLKLEIRKAGETPNLKAKKKIDALQQQIKQNLADAITSSRLQEKHEKLRAEISDATKSSSSMIKL